jgi:tripartite motif-containing protein 71
MQRRAKMTAILLMLAMVGLSAPGALGEEPGAVTQLSLQLRREDEATPPAEPLPEVEFARYDRSFGGYGIISGYFDSPVDLAVSSAEKVYVLDSGNNRIQVFDSSTRYLSNFGAKGTRDGEFDSPQAIAIDPSESVYVVDSGNHRIQKFDQNGRFLLQWGSLGSRAGLLNRPVDMTIDQENAVYVADPENQRIQKFTPGGRFIEEWSALTLRQNAEVVVFRNIVSLAYDSDRFGYVLALNAKDKVVYRFKLNGDYQDSWPVTASDPCYPMRIEVDNDYQDKLVYILDRAGNRVLRFTNEGAAQGELKKGDREFKEPLGLCVDRPHRRLYVADTGNNIVQKFYQK